MASELYLRAPHEKRRPPPGRAAVIHLDEPGLSGYPLHHNLPRLPAVPGPPAQAVAAFLSTALGVWAADKFVPRRAAPDAWTRQITLHLPVSPGWLPLASPLTRLLNFLTGDDWTLKLREANLNLGLQGEWPCAWRPDAVMLFSGGLDSLVGALNALEAGERLLLVSHYDFGQLAAIQQTLAAALLSHYGPDRLRHLGLRVQFPHAPELSLRSRSLLYLALGLAAAAGFGPATPLIIPENGWISLNPPLTANRLGSCSTRTTHPFFLEQLTGLRRAAGLVNPLANPYEKLTKGDMVARSRHPELLSRLFRLSVSCARPVVSRWQKGAAGACGYCYPCLMRRAALHTRGWDDGAHYRRDVFAEPDTLTHRVRGRDLRALLVALRTWEADPAEVEARLMVGAAPESLPARLAAARRVLDRGFGEIAAWLRDQGPAWVREYGR
jgi:7-cyano-7-deazaguanine synthase in queuosine biosynthesis